MEARKQIDKSKDKLQLIIARSGFQAKSHPSPSFRQHDQPGKLSDNILLHYYPAPGRYRERGIVFARFLCLFVCFFVSLSARLRENGWTDLHEIFREGVE